VSAEDRSPKFRYTLDLDVDTRNALSDKKRDEAIQQLETLIPRFDDSNPDKPDLYFQLSELYWEKYRYLYALEESRQEQVWKKYQAATARGEKLPEPGKADHSGSEKYRADTMRQYEAILRDFPRYPRTDEVLFSLAYNLHETGKQSEAVKRYNELIKRFPKSQFVPDAYVQLGDHWFEQNNLAKAKANFEKAFESDVPKIHSYALYKLAWCDYNAGDLELALKKLHDVIDFAEQHGKTMVDLKNEALNDLVVVYVQLNRGQDAIAYFEKKASPERQGRLIGKLAYALADAGHHDSAIKTFRYLLEKDPMRADAPEFQQAVVRSYDKMFQRAQVKTEIRRLAELYSPGSEWWKANEKEQSVLRNAFEVSEEAMRTLVTDYHQEAQKTKQVETYRLARDIYKQYVDAFASSSDPRFVSDYAFNLRFYYAEILWTLEEWTAAAEQYDVVVAFKVPDRETAREVSNEQYRKSAAFNAILAYDKLLKIERGQLAVSNLKDGQKVDEAKKKGGVDKGAKIVKRSAKELEPKELSRIEQRLVSACDAYTQLFPGEKDEIDIRYQAAVIFYDKNQFVDAAKRFGDIILKWPEEKRSQQAADLTMYILDAKEEWFELARLSKQFYENKRLAKPGTDFTKRLAGIVEGAQYKWIDEVVYKKEKNPTKAAQEFLAFAKDFPKSKMADRALTYAMVMFQETRQLDHGVEAGERVLTEHPSSPLEPKVRYTLARMYEQMADFPRSAVMYESFVSSFDKHARQHQEAVARHKAKKSGKKKGADASKAEEPAADEGEDAVAEKLEQEGKLIEEARAWLADAQFNAALWYEGLGQTDKALAAYRQYISRFKDRKDVPEIAFNIGLLYEKDGKWAEAARAFEDFSRGYAKDSRSTGSQHFLARYRVLKARRTMKDTREADRLVDELVRGYAHLSAEEKQDGDVLNAYAHARFLALEPLWKSYTDIRFKQVSTIKRDLNAKKKKLQDIERAYGDIISIGVGEYGIAALVRLGQAYADMAKNITESPDPKGLDEEQLNMYREQLEKLSMPLEDKAVEALEKGLEKAYELAVYNDWTLQAQDQLNKFRPGMYPKVQEVQYRGSEFFVTAPLLKDAMKKAVHADPAPEPAQQPPAPPPAQPAETKEQPATPHAELSPPSAPSTDAGAR
jgi:tetratricopeptide (TPR) repeat protein